MIQYDLGKYFSLNGVKKVILLLCFDNSTKKEKQTNDNYVPCLYRGLVK